MKLALTWPANEDETARIRAVLPADAEIVIAPKHPYLSRYDCDTGAFCAEVAQADVMMGWVVSRELIDAAPDLQIMIWLHAGVDQFDFEHLRARGVKLANVSGSNAVAVTEETFALMLGLAKKIVSVHQGVVDGVWRPWWDPDHAGTMLAGKTVGIIGMGRIGREIAKRAKAFDMRIVGVKRQPRKDADLADVIYPPEALHEALGASDFVVLALPHTDATHQVIGEAELKAMRRDAFLINIARAHIIAEPPLYQALVEGWIAGFASDVWWNYAGAMPSGLHFPVPSQTGIHKLPNVLCAGDASANILAVKDAMIDHGIESLATFVRGEPLLREVDLTMGY